MVYRDSDGKSTQVRTHYYITGSLLVKVVMHVSHLGTVLEIVWITTKTSHKNSEVTYNTTIATFYSK